ncbi:3D domain-containing protein [Exiguobacterium sp. AM39-5BH]|uniref:3D domain-containing protein n=1 Tax=Exiguobacterium sp. AM39-5BH TaxID=2292355 RepID=UPI001EECEC6E|nr:3D domain-containing protein [Exiguobacterium sp. AM39-5BH]
MAVGTFAFAETVDAAQIGIGTEQKIVQNPLELERKAIEQERQQQMAREKRRAEQKRIAEEKRVAAEKVQQEEAKRQAAIAKQQTTTPTSIASSVSTTGRSIQAESTAYTNDAADNGSYGGRVLTATGHDVTDSIFYKGMRIIAVDPSIIPLGTVVHIDGIGQAIALDTGGRIQGNIVDLLVDTNNEAMNWGRRHITITLP